MKPYILVLLISLFFIPALSGQHKSDSTTVFSLQKLTDYALAHNYDLKNAKADIGIAKSQKWQTTAIGLPQANLSGNFQYLPEIPEMRLPASVTVVPDPANPFYHMHIDTSGVMELGSEYSGNIDFTLTQLIFSGEYIVGLRASKIYMDLSETAYDKKLLDIKEDITKSYYLALITQESILILDSVYQTLNELYEDTKVMYNTGFLEETDVEQVHLNIKTTENSLISFRNQKEVIYRLLKLQIGMDMNDSLELASDLQTMTQNVESGLLSADDFNASQTVDFQLIEVQSDLAHLDMQREKTTYLPTISAYYRHQEQINAPEFNFSSPDVIGASVNLPIFSSGLRHAKVQQKKLEYQQMQNNKAQYEQALNLQYQQARADYNAAVSVFLNQKESRILSEKIYENTLLKFKSGTESGIQLTQTQTQYFQALSAYYQSLNDLIDKHITLKRILNQL